MLDPKSLIEAMPRLIGSLLRDFIARTSIYSEEDLNRDSRTIIRRLSTEGIPVVTKLLPTLSKAVIRALETGTFVLPNGFKRRHGTKLPVIFYRLLSSIFTQDGSLLEQPDPDAILCINQIGSLFYKLQLNFTKAQEVKAIKTFLEVENDLSSLSFDPLLDHYLDGANETIRELFSGFDPREIEPRHGPGAVATGERYDGKWNFKRRYRGIERFYLDPRYFFASHAHFTERRNDWLKRVQLEEGCSKLAFVPKDSRGPRSIAMEPLEYQFLQQGLGRKITTHIEKHDSPAKGLVNFSDQSINRRLALVHSQRNEYATLDMKEASDRVSMKLVGRLFKGTELLKALFALRTPYCNVKGHEILQRKFAAMGSALCFPIESIVFWSLAEAIRRHWRIKGKVYTFGDDLIVPKGLVKYLFEYFPLWGLKFNEDKCFINGPFRESCGMDAFKGIPVTPTRFKTLWPKRRKPSKIDASKLSSAIGVVNRFHEDGWWHFADALRARLLDNYPFLSGLPITSVKDTFGGVSLKSFSTESLYIGRRVEDLDTQAPRLKTWVFEGVSCRSSLDGYDRLQKDLLQPQKGSYKITQAPEVSSSKRDMWQRRVPVLQTGSKPAMVLRKKWIPIWGISCAEKAMESFASSDNN